MGKSPERTAASAGGGSENNKLGSREAHHVASRPEEDRGVSAGEVGEAEGTREEGGVASQLTEGCKSRT